LRADAATSGKEIARAAVVQGQARLRIPGAPGLYALSYDDGQEPACVIAVNPPPEESRLVYAASPEELAGWLRRTSDGETGRGERHSDLQLSQVEILRQRIWWWFLVAGLAALVSETTWLSLRKVQA